MLKKKKQLINLFSFIIMRNIRKITNCILWSLSIVLSLFIVYTEVIKINRQVESKGDKYVISVINRSVTKLPLPGNGQTQSGHGVKNDLVNVTSQSMRFKEAAEDMAKRRQHLEGVCKTLSLDQTKPILPRALVSVEKNIVYCPVEKVASTFFRRLLFQLEYLDQIRSPYKVPIQLIYQCPSLFTKLENLAKDYKLRSRTITKGKKSDTETVRTFLNNSFHFIFVRDPFSRLFSVYVDKLLAPNPTFWEKWGIVAVKKFRKKPSPISLKCGHDVTFSEFLKLVLHQDAAVLDPHLRPMTFLCRPCHTRYDIIGNMSTFDRDFGYLASLLNLTESQLAMGEMATAESRDAVEDAVVEPFTSWAPGIAKCASKRQAATRIWKKLQLRGIISSDLDFAKHVVDADVDKMEASEYVAILIKALGQSRNSTKLHKQKKDAFLDAYKEVNKGILKRITKLYLHDLKLFGFNEKIQELLK